MPAKTYNIAYDVQHTMLYLQLSSTYVLDTLHRTGMYDIVDHDIVDFVQRVLTMLYVYDIECHDVQYRTVILVFYYIVHPTYYIVRYKNLDDGWSHLDSV